MATSVKAGSAVLESISREC